MLKGLTLSAVAKAVGGKYFGPAEKLNAAVSSVVTDSRSATKDCLFAAVKGERFDGHDFAAAALERGALCTVGEHELPEPYILVENTVAALQRLAAFYRRSLNVTVVGVTGSVGKTTCKEVVASILEQKYNVHKTKGNFNNEIGLPLTLLSMTGETQVAVIEMGMSDFGEMSLLSSVARPDMCIITNIGHSHMENLGSQQGILKAKCEIFDSMAEDAPSFLNGDDALLNTVKRKNAVRFGFGDNCAIRAEELNDKGLLGTEGVIAVRGEKIPFSLAIAGRHMLYAVMAGAGVGLELGLSREEISEGIKSAAAIDGRVNIINKGNIRIIDDCYNAAPASMKAGIDLLASADGESAAILGDMGELGETAPALHAEVGSYAAEKGIGLTVAVGELSRNLYEACVSNGGNAVYFETKTALLEHLKEVVPKKGALLVKASHFMGFDEVVRSVEALAEQQ